jgi:hypothetical protein
MDAELSPMTCSRCGAEFGRGDDHCPGCGASRAEAKGPPPEDRDEVTEASEDSFPASDPPAY